MSEIICYMPTYSPNTEADTSELRSYSRLTQQQIQERIDSGTGTVKPFLYMDAIDSILNTRSDVKLVVADGKSTESIREALCKHHFESGAAYDLALYADKKSQWWIFNDLLDKYTTSETKYFIYSSSDIIWQSDWVSEAIKEFEHNPKVQILFPCVNRGDPNLPCQIAPGPRDLDPYAAPYQSAARAPVLNAYAMIFRMDFLRAYGGYPSVFRNCFTESFLHYMCEAMGGQMLIMPRGWVYHYGEGDKWMESGGSPYHYTEEKFLFEDIMNTVAMAKAMNMMNVDFIKKTLKTEKRDV